MGTFLEVNQQLIITTLASWDAVLDLQHLAAASSAGTSLEATWDAVWKVYLDFKWARQRLRLYGDGGSSRSPHAAEQPHSQQPQS
ncbi:hypothetical protein HaLaN_22162 [Haematococcus lacustris]|uniref:Uncharacterized protein n=1 Tax=Haematococcus lacustris TaxID=44745 RepID=A0A699ZZN6_HAELA|nr:hypothetical protein HaLaN_22162 [Haematococcus lacustris]